jgi:hypothetical protein
MSKKENKRDVAVFSNMLKDLMNEPLDSPLTTLDRDLQHFIYGRIAVLIKHNQGQPFGSLKDVGVVVGAALADVSKEFVRGKAEDDQVKEIFDKVLEGVVEGFKVRTPDFARKEAENDSQLS